MTAHPKEKYSMHKIQIQFDSSLIGNLKIAIRIYLGGRKNRQSVERTHCLGRTEELSTALTLVRKLCPIILAALYPSHLEFHHPLPDCPSLKPSPHLCSCFGRGQYQPAWRSFSCCPAFFQLLSQPKLSTQWTPPMWVEGSSLGLGAHPFPRPEKWRSKGNASHLEINSLGRNNLEALQLIDKITNFLSLQLCLTCRRIYMGYFFKKAKNSYMNSFFRCMGKRQDGLSFAYKDIHAFDNYNKPTDFICYLRRGLALTGFFLEWLCHRWNSCFCQVLGVLLRPPFGTSPNS